MGRDSAMFTSFTYSPINPVGLVYNKNKAHSTLKQPPLNCLDRKHDLVDLVVLCTQNSNN